MAIPLVLFGAGGHARVIIDLCFERGVYIPVVCLGTVDAESNGGIPIQTDADALRWRSEGVAHAHIAIGDNSVRKRVAEDALRMGFSLATFVSPHAYVARSAYLGDGVVVMPSATVQSGAHIGDLTIVNTGACVDHDCKIGRAVHIAPGATLCGNVAVGDRVWIGAGASIIEKIKICNDVLLGAGAVVVADISSPGTYVGVPARLCKKPERL